MKLFCIAIAEHSGAGQAKLLAVEHDLSSFGFFQRGRCVYRFYFLWGVVGVDTWIELNGAYSSFVELLP